MEDSVLAFLKSKEKCTASEIVNGLAIAAAELVGCLNTLLTSGKIEAIGDVKAPFYRVAVDAQKFIGMSQDERLVYQCIEAAGNKGIWTRDLRHKTNLLSGVMTKILKSFESRKYIKSVKTVAGSKKKVYMLFNIEPDKALSGGAWYADREFDSQYVDTIIQVISNFMKQKHDEALASRSVESQIADGYVTCEEVTAYIAAKRISHVELEEDDIEKVLQVLVYDNCAIQKVHPLPYSFPSSFQPRYRRELEKLGYDLSSETMLFRFKDAYIPPTHLLTVPCGVCPVFENCHDHGVVSPQGCPYMKEFIDKDV